MAIHFGQYRDVIVSTRNRVEYSGRDEQRSCRVLKQVVQAFDQEPDVEVVPGSTCESIILRERFVIDYRAIDFTSAITLISTTVPQFLPIARRARSLFDVGGRLEFVLALDGADEECPAHLPAMDDRNHFAATFSSFLKSIASLFTFHISADKRFVMDGAFELVFNASINWFENACATQLLENCAMALRKDMAVYLQDPTLGLRRVFDDSGQLALQRFVELVNVHECLRGRTGLHRTRSLINQLLTRAVHVAGLYVPDRMRADEIGVFQPRYVTATTLSFGQDPTGKKLQFFFSLIGETYIPPSGSTIKHAGHVLAQKRARDESDEGDELQNKRRCTTPPAEEEEEEE